MRVRECLDQILSGPWLDREDDELLTKCLNQIPEGLVMEFGVATGGSFNKILDRTSRPCYGFDSFKGLPEASEGWQEGMFACAVPSFTQPNAIIIEGLIQDTLPDFLSQHAEPAAFIHIDTDIYSSAKYILDTLYAEKRFVPGSIILFDELFNCEHQSYAAWEPNEYKAFVEFGDATGTDIELVGRRQSNSYAFKILAI